MASKVYPKALELLNAGTLTWTSDTIKIMLVDDTAAYNRAHDFVNDVVADELSGATRQTLGTKTSADNGTDKWVFDAADPTFPSVTGSQTLGAAIVYKEITDDASSPLLAFVDGTDISTTGQNVDVVFGSDGVFHIGY